ncbi:hypothetical protein HG536_0C06260 [Torulaspora globosa]|uniref:Small-subunit processome Utp12 domain-containing protein n=1 Tax=Torulaspora globosa TaxID=48254 RepID=A0A7G3ZG21_9SACH|nr:uncharacterized protein HG536_0C06260 [Torulaspora globosa]QLL32457.1 hypothetical protein HG536_0C06260 [Torulaspora globosa]
MSSNSDIIASFSPDVREFAFQAKTSQKNVVDIYPLDAAKDYSVNSSLVNHIDYETNDLQASDIFFAGWCSGLREDDKQRAKRKNDSDGGEEIDTEDKLENFFISVQASGKIVVFPSSGKNIVNMIQSKSDILQASVEGSFIWILDSERTVKKFQYNQAKQLRSFQLIGGKDSEIVYFEILKYEELLYLCYASNDTLYIVDPTKRRPSMIAKLPINGCKSCQLLDNERIAVATPKSVLTFNYKIEALEQEWHIEVKHLSVFKDIILCQGLADNIVGFKVGTDSPVFQVRVADAHLLGVALVEEGIMIAWLNVNEPNFESLSIRDLIGNRDVVIKGQTGSNPTYTEQLADGRNGSESEEGEVEQAAGKAISNNKITKAEQIELSKSLISALESGDNDQILELLISTAWNEPKIKSFIAAQSLTENSLCTLFELTTSEVQKHPWNDNQILSLWFKWLLTLKPAIYSSFQHSKHARKHNKRLRSSLKSSGDTLPILLGIQGRLEMLKRQAQLREDLAQLNITENEADGEIETVVQEEDRESLQISGDQDDSIAYANGESDTFVDASDFTNVK